MDPLVTIVRLGDVARPIGSFGVMLAVAIVVGAFVGARAASRAGIDPAATLAVIGLTVGGALASGYVTFALVEWVRTGSPLDALRHGGLVFFGGLVGGAAVLLVACRALGLPALRLLDVGVVAIPLAHALGRIGCFLGGCCYGAPYDGVFSVRYTHPLAPASAVPVDRHPTPLYESAALMVLAAVFALVPKERVGDGRRFGAYVAAYALLRFGLEMLRGDDVRGVIVGVLSTSQVFSLLLLLGVVASWRAHVRMRLRTERANA